MLKRDWEGKWQKFLVKFRGECKSYGCTRAPIEFSHWCKNHDGIAFATSAKLYYQRKAEEDFQWESEIVAEGIRKANERNWA